MESILANELRIGNYVNYMGNPTDCNIKTIYAISQICGETVIYLPIPITEEWLLKFGFEKINTTWFQLWNLRVNISGDVEWGKNWMGVRLKHVHQLQNLYFALTNKELQLK
jgi:hypothetical protein